MLIRIALSPEVTANIKNDYLEIRLPSQPAPEGLAELVEQTVGRDFCDLALKSLHGYSMLAALKNVIR